MLDFGDTKMAPYTWGLKSQSIKIIYYIGILIKLSEYKFNFYQICPAIKLTGQFRLYQGRVLNKMESIEKKLNKAIQIRGYRISPRGTVADRLSRYVEMSTGMSRAESTTVATLYLMREQNSQTWQNSEDNSAPSNTYVQPRTHSYNLRPRAETGSHPMIRRSQVARQ